MLLKGEFQPGDIVLVKGKSWISRLIMWAEGADVSHSTMICCRLNNGDYMMLDLTLHGILIRPLSIYQGQEFRVYRVKGVSKSLGEQEILRLLKYVAHAGYAFEKLLFLGLVKIPTRLVRGSPMKSNEIGYDRSKGRLKPKGKLQKITYFVCRVIAIMTLMKYWSTILAVISRDKWLIFTYRVMDKIGYEKIENEVVTFDEFVGAIEKELVSMKVYELSRATMEILLTERRHK